jgi:hypothetical protein
MWTHSIARVVVFCCHASLAVSVFAAATGTVGINSAVTNLTGQGIGIGQIELRRPGKEGVDVPANLHNLVKPEEVFRRNSLPDIADTNEHAQQVAGVMIAGFSGSLTGVAPEAKLYASACRFWHPW